jgi:hypothetical protein
VARRWHDSCVTMCLTLLNRSDCPARGPDHIQQVCAKLRVVALATLPLAALNTKPPIATAAAPVPCPTATSTSGTFCHPSCQLSPRPQLPLTCTLSARVCSTPACTLPARVLRSTSARTLPARVLSALPTIIELPFLSSTSIFSPLDGSPVQPSANLFSSSASYASERACILTPSGTIASFSSLHIALSAAVAAAIAQRCDLAASPTVSLPSRCFPVASVITSSTESEIEMGPGVPTGLVPALLLEWGEGGCGGLSLEALTYDACEGSTDIVISCI